MQDYYRVARKNLSGGNDVVPENLSNSADRGGFARGGIALAPWSPSSNADFDGGVHGGSNDDHGDNDSGNNFWDGREGGRRKRL